MESVKICRFKKSLERICARRNLFPFRYFSIHVKMCSNAIKQQRKASAITHERCANFRHRKKKQKRGKLKTLPRPTGRRSNKTPKIHIILEPAWSRGLVGGRLGWLSRIVGSILAVVIRYILCLPQCEYDPRITPQTSFL